MQGEDGRAAMQEHRYDWQGLLAHDSFHVQAT